MSDGVDVNLRGDVSCSADNKMLVRGILELEMRLKKEIFDVVFPSNQKILCELNKVQSNFARVFNVLEKHDALLNDITSKINQQCTCMDREHEQMSKRIDDVERILFNNNSREFIGMQPVLSHHNRNFVGGRNNFDQFPERTYKQHAISRTNPLFLRTTSPFPNPNTQFTSSDKMWTTRGNGTFTSEDESDEEDVGETALPSTPPPPPSTTLVEKISKLVVSDPSSLPKIDCGTTDSNNNNIKIVKPEKRFASHQNSVSNLAEEDHLPSPNLPTFTETSSNSPERHLVGGFGNFRRGKPTPISTATPAQDLCKPKLETTESGNSSNNNDKFSENYNIVERPLTMDELEVLSKTGAKSVDSPISSGNGKNYGKNRNSGYQYNGGSSTRKNVNIRSKGGGVHY